jgi:glycosyltransferase involved in cell wall biosynthesis
MQEGMRILIATDAWEPQVNGVVTTLKKIQQLVPGVMFITPDSFKCYDLPFYNEIKLSIVHQDQLEVNVSLYNPDYIHIATEGPIGLAVRKWCIKNNKKFTTSYHTKFPEFLQVYFKIPTWMTYWYFKWFHSTSSGVMVATDSLAEELKNRGFKNLVKWTRGVDLEQFTPSLDHNKFIKTLLYVGRVSKEKNIEEFLRINLNSTQFRKVVVGDGPDLERLRSMFNQVEFVGYKSGVELAQYYQDADVFVFPSRADTFGLVIIEALACGTPVVAFNVTGPKDILTEQTGVMDNNLSYAVGKALRLKREDCVSHARTYSWENAINIFKNNLVNSNSKISSS